MKRATRRAKPRHKQSHTYSKLDILLASTRPMPADQRQRYIAGFTQALQAIQFEPVSTREHWRVMADAVNLVETFCAHPWPDPDASGELIDIADEAETIPAAVEAMREAARLHKMQGGNIRLSAQGHPRPGVQVQSSAQLMSKVPAHKSLFNAPALTGLPIGNLSSQFFANVHLDALDQFIKHQIKAKHYARYVDDFILIHESPQWLHQAHQRITAWLPEHLGLRLNDSKTIVQPVSRGVDFVGQVIKPWRRQMRRRTLKAGLHRIASMPSQDTYAAGNSYLGLARQASKPHTTQARIAKALMKRGHTVSGDLQKVFPI